MQLIDNIIHGTAQVLSLTLPRFILSDFSAISATEAQYNHYFNYSQSLMIKEVAEEEI